MNKDVLLPVASQHDCYDRPFRNPLWGVLKHHIARLSLFLGAGDQGPDSGRHRNLAVRHSRGLMHDVGLALRQQPCLTGRQLDLDSLLSCRLFEFFFKLIGSFDIIF